MSRYLNILAFVILCITGVTVISTVTPYWITENILVDNNPVYAYAGLWKTCAESGATTDCEAYSDVKDWVDAVRSFMIAGATLIGLGCLGVLMVSVDSSNQTSRRNAKVFNCLFFSGIVLIIAVSIFSKNIDDDKVSYGSSYYLAILAAVMAILSSVAFVRGCVQLDNLRTSQPSHTTRSA